MNCIFFTRAAVLLMNYCLLCARQARGFTTTVLRHPSSTAFTRAVHAQRSKPSRIIPCCDSALSFQRRFARLATTDSGNSSSEKDDDGSSRNSNKQERQRKRPVSKKLKIKEITQENADLLAAAFDEMAKKDGFDSSLSLMADDDTFEDQFDDDDYEDDDEGEFLDDDDDDDDEEGEADDDDDVDNEDFLDAAMFDVSDFDPKAIANSLTEGKQALGSSGVEESSLSETSTVNDMDARIAAAEQALSTGRVDVPKGLDQFALESTDGALSELGFKRELYNNEFVGADEGRGGFRDQFKLISNAMSCQACGSDFQSTNELKPGFLPKEKFDIQVKLNGIEEAQRLQEKAESQEWSPEDEIEYLIQTAGGKSAENPLGAADIDIASLIEESGLDIEALSKKPTICKRCHGLQNSGKVDEALRPGWTQEPTISQQKFRDLLRPISEKPAVVVALIDLFDFNGSVLRELDGIAGENPVILAANKVDLLPSNMGLQRAENWVRRELEYMGVRSLANVGGAVRLISCKSGLGVFGMLAKARRVADDMDCDVYVVGAANAGKSTLINHILRGDSKKDPTARKSRAGNQNSFKGALTTSPLPGTTLKFIKIDIGDGKALYDTPGLLVPGTYTQLLTPEELKIVCPKKPVEPITFRVASGKCVLVGGLARVEVVGDSRPFLLTFFVANDIKLHPTDATRADDFVLKHSGDMLTPPLAPGPERMAELGEFESHIVDIEGNGWKEAAADITLTGVGWVAVTGAGSVKIKISVPKGIGISVRPPLMPFDVWEVASKYTGAKATRKSGKTKSGKKRKGVGRR